MRFAAALFVLLVAVNTALGRSGPRAVTTSEPLRVVLTIRPLELIVHDLLAPEDRALVQFNVLIPAGTSEHGFEPSPRNIADIRKSELLISIGLGMDDWASRALPAGAPSQSIRAADVLQLAPHSHDHEHHHAHEHGDDCDHDHGPIDPHIWLDPALAEKLAVALHAALRDKLATSSPGITDRLDARLAAFRETTAQVDQAFRDGLAPYSGRPIITFHNAFNRVVERYDLKLAAVLMPIEHVEPAPGDLRAAIEAIRTHSIPSVFIEPQFSPAAAERIAAQTGVKLITLDPLGSSADTWAGMMNDILSALREGLAQQSTPKP